MKKTAFLFTVLIAFLIAGCNEKNLVNNITGTWHVSKYVVDGADKTRFFDTTYAGFKWNFTSDRKYTKTWTERRIGNVYTYDTIRHYDSVAQVTVIDSVSTTSAIVPFVYTNNVYGTWVLTNGNRYLEARDSLKNTQFQIVSHANSSMHLYAGNEDYYLAQ
jgi:hypothetical protein